MDQEPKPEPVEEITACYDENAGGETLNYQQVSALFKNMKSAACSARNQIAGVQARLLKAELAITPEQESDFNKEMERYTPIEDTVNTQGF